MGAKGGHPRQDAEDLPRHRNGERRSQAEADQPDSIRNALRFVFHACLISRLFGSLERVENGAPRKGEVGERIGHHNRHTRPENPTPGPLLVAHDRPGCPTPGLGDRSENAPAEEGAGE